MLQLETFIDLLSIAASAPSQAYRGAAHWALARETSARLDCSDEDARRIGVVPGHPAYDDVQEVDSSTSLGALLASVRLRGGADAARLYYYHGARFWNQAVPRVPAAQSAYDAALAEVVALAPQIRSAVLTTMDSVAWSAARQPWVDLFARRDFLTSSAVGRFRIDDEAAPGGTFKLRAWGPPSVGYGMTGDDEISQLTFATPGAYRFHMHGPARSQSTAPNTSITITLVDGSTQRASISGTRQSSNAAESTVLGHEGYAFLPSEGNALTIAGNPFTVRNASASMVRLEGAVLLLWR